MGLFGKIFEKKECSICGGEIGLLGNRKLEDGNMCKNCASLLSPWMTDRRHQTRRGRFFCHKECTIVTKSALLSR